jgi:transposase
MTSGRKTTIEELVEIVSFCIVNNYNYQIASDKFQVSYQQVYTWVEKYEESRSEALSGEYFVVAEPPFRLALSHAHALNEPPCY